MKPFTLNQPNVYRQEIRGLQERSSTREGEPEYGEQMRPRGHKYELIEIK